MNLGGVSWRDDVSSIALACAKRHVSGVIIAAKVATFANDSLTSHRVKT